MTPELASRFDAVLSILAGPGPQRVRVARAWLLHLSDLPATAVPDRHRDLLVRFGAAMSSTERFPLSRDDAAFWARWLLALAVEAQAAPTRRIASLRPSCRPSAPARRQVIDRTSLRPLSPFTASRPARA